MFPIRNFVIISHIDHGKSTLADRFLEITKTIPKEKMREQYLDRMSLEREHGVTIKMHPVRMRYYLNFPISDLEFRDRLKAQGLESDSEFILNLIDTPGHVDFSYEVSRALAAVEGAILLVDVLKGIQAQTLANLELAKKENLIIIPVINKIDLASREQIEKRKEEISQFLSEEIDSFLSLDKKEILEISAKKGTGTENLILKIIEKIPPPKKETEKPFKALIFDSRYDPFFGVIAYLRVFEGKIKKGEKIYFLRKKIEGIAKEIGYFSPELKEGKELLAGEIGYLKTGIKDPEKIRVGETLIKSPIPDLYSIKALEGYQEPNPVVFSSIFPKEPSTFNDLRKAIEELHLSDPAFFYEREEKKGIGVGFRLGFLGIFHFEIILERLKKEFNLSFFIIRPSVSFEIIEKDKNESYFISSPQDFPESIKIKEIREPWVKIEIFTPPSYFNNIFQLFPFFKINLLSNEYFGKNMLKIIAEMPFRKLIENFYDKLKSVSQGFASLNFKIIDWRSAFLIKLDILILKKIEPTLSKIIEKDELEREARRAVERLKEIFPPQLYSVPLQAAVGGKIIARETIKAKRKDVTAPLYGGDVTRKKKLLKKQKLGKKKLLEKAKIALPQEIILNLLKE